MPDAADLAAFWDLAVEMLSIVSLTEQRFTHVNRSWERALGWSREEFLEKDLAELIHPDDLGPTMTVIADMATPNASLQGFENRYLDARGRYRRLRWWSRADADGRLVYSVTRDITEEHAAEQALARSEERWRLAQEESTIGLTLVSLDGRWLTVNQAMCDLTGYSEEELRELTFQDITHPDDLDADLAHLEQLLAGAIPSYRMEKRYIRKSGEAVWILLSVSLIRTPAGEPELLLAQIVDISVQKRQERELEQLVATLERANSDLERFTALAAHDLRSPLSTVASFLELVAEEQLSDDGRTFLEHAGRGIDRLQRRTEALLRFGRATALPLDVQPHDVATMVQEAVALLGALVRDRDAEVTCEVDPGATVEVDGETIGSVLQNLLSNAIRYVPETRRPVVRITGRRVDGEVVLTIDDNGPGIPADDRARMFEPFVRGPVRAEGTGLGLATAQRLVERNGGSVVLEDAPSGGTRVTLRLPAGPVSIPEATRRDRETSGT